MGYNQDISDTFTGQIMKLSKNHLRGTSVSGFHDDDADKMVRNTNDLGDRTNSLSELSDLDKLIERSGLVK